MIFLENLNPILFCFIGLALAVIGIYDARTGKIPNLFSYSLFGLFGLLCVVGFAQPDPLTTLFLLSITFITVLLLLPLNILGGGDLKLFLCFSLLLSPENFGYLIILSILWAAVLGLAQSIINGKLLYRINTTFGVFKKFSIAEGKIPYSVGIFFAWLTLPHYLVVGNLL